MEYFRPKRQEQPKDTKALSVKEQNSAENGSASDESLERISEWQQVFTKQAKRWETSFETDKSNAIKRIYKNA